MRKYLKSSSWLYKLNCWHQLLKVQRNSRIPRKGIGMQSIKLLLPCCATNDKPFLEFLCKSNSHLMTQIPFACWNEYFTSLIIYGNLNLIICLQAAILSQMCSNIMLMLSRANELLNEAHSIEDIFQNLVLMTSVYHRMFKQFKTSWSLGKVHLKYLNFSPTNQSWWNISRWSFLFPCPQFQSMSVDILRQNAKQMQHRKIMFAVWNSTDFSACHFSRQLIFFVFHRKWKNNKTSDWRFQFSLQSLDIWKCFQMEWSANDVLLLLLSIISFYFDGTESFFRSFEMRWSFSFNRTRQRENKTSFFGELFFEHVSQS